MKDLEIIEGELLPFREFGAPEGPRSNEPPVPALRVAPGPVPASAQSAWPVPHRPDGGALPAMYSESSAIQYYHAPPRAQAVPVNRPEPDVIDTIIGLIIAGFVVGWLLWRVGPWLLGF